MLTLSALALLISIIFLMHCFKMLIKLRPFKAFMRLLISLVLFSLSILIFITSSLEHTYLTLSAEKMIATIEIKQLANQDYLLTLTEEKSKPKNYELHGDQWMLSAEVLVWKNIGQLLGLHSRIRLYRLEGIYNNLNIERKNEHSVYDLSFDDSWPSALERVLLSGLTRTVFGDAAYMPLVDGAKYEVMLTQTGLIIIPTPSLH